MKFREFQQQRKQYGVVNTGMIKTVYGDQRKYVSRLISERSDKHRLIQLKKWLYTFVEQDIHPFWYANKIQEPSYISTYSALELYGLIPEKVARITSISQTKTITHTNEIGVFWYQRCASSVFWWYVSQRIVGRDVLIAEAEKALLDLIYLLPEQENPVWFLRLQHLDRLDCDKLANYAHRFASPKMKRFLVRITPYFDDPYTTI